ncbi:hypothetical protein [Gordonia sp. 'Campus']|uniref:hypothetical protein n=1 Tax=Gordonia sp. 'Campus' TaxID=2915824 RepID=UPI0027DF3997|nr:hypothetical protein [Gordonia sp. 'Campus']
MPDPDAVHRATMAALGCDDADLRRDLGVESVPPKCGVGAQRRVGEVAATAIRARMRSST